MFNVGSVQGYLKLNTTGWTTGMGRANASLAGLSRAMVRFGAVTVGSLLLIEREFGKFDKAIRHATSVSEVTEEQFAKMSKMALDASVQWNKSAASTAQAFYYLGSAGLSATEQMQAFNDTIMLSRAMGSELSMTVEGFVDVVKAFNLEFADSARIADMLTATVISSNQVFRDLDRALSYAASTAQWTNNTLSETAAMLGVMANAGIKGSMAGTVLRRAMTNLVSPTREMSEMMIRLGFTAYNSAGKTKPMIEALADIAEGLRGASEAERNWAFEVLFGRRAIAGQIKLFDYTAESLRKYGDSILNNVGITQKVANKQMKAFTEQLGRMWQQVRRTSIVIGGTLAPAVESLATKVRMYFEALEKYVKQNKEAVAQTLKFTAVLGVASVLLPPLTIMLTGITNQFIQLGIAAGKGVIGISKLAVAFTKFGWTALMAITPIAGPLAAIILVLYTMRALLKKEGLWEAMMAGIDKATDSVTAFLGMLHTGVKQTVAQIMWEVSLIPRAIKSKFMDLLGFAAEWGKQMVLIIMSFLSGNPKLMLEAIQIGNKRLLKTLTPEMPHIPSIIDLFGSEEEMMESYQSYVGDLNNIMDNLITPTAEAATKAAKKALATALRATLDHFKYVGDALFSSLERDFGGLIEKFSKMLTDLPEDVMKALPVPVLEFITQFKDGISQALTIIGESYDAFINGIEESNKKAEESIDDLSKELETYPREIIKKHNNLLKEWRIALSGFFAPELQNVQTWAKKLGTALDDIQAAWSDTIYNTMSKGTTLKNFMEDMFLGILNAFNRMMAEIIAQDMMFALLGKQLINPITGQPMGRSPGTPSIWSDIVSPFMGLFRPDVDTYSPGRGDFPIASGSIMAKAAPVAINNNIINNTNTQISARKSAPQFDGKQWVVNTVLEAYDTDPGVRSRLGGR